VPAEAALREARAIAEETDDLRGLCYAQRDLAWSASKLGRAEEAIDLARAALALALDLDDDRLVAMTSSDLGTFLVIEDKARDEALELLETGLAYHRRIEDELNVATVLINLAGVDLGRGDAAEARRHLEEALEIAWRLEAVLHIANAAEGLGLMALEEGDSAAALRLYREALESARETGATGEILLAVEGIAFSVASVDAGPAVRLLGAARAIRAELEMQLDPITAKTYTRLVEIIRGDLGADVFEQEASPGAAALSLDDAVTLALDLARASTAL
jgi:tetratricopeptide (TPR) repeat protein